MSANTKGDAPPAARPSLLDTFFRCRESSILVVAILLAGYFQYRNSDFLTTRPAWRTCRSSSPPGPSSPAARSC